MRPFPNIYHHTILWHRVCNLPFYNGDCEASIWSWGIFRPCFSSSFFRFYTGLVSPIFHYLNPINYGLFLSFRIRWIFLQTKPDFCGSTTTRRSGNSFVIRWASVSLSVIKCKSDVAHILGFVSTTHWLFNPGGRSLSHCVSWPKPPMLRCPAFITRYPDFPGQVG